MKFARAWVFLLAVLAPWGEVRAQSIADVQLEGFAEIDALIGGGNVVKAVAVAEKAVFKSKQAPTDVQRQADALDLLAYAYSAAALNEPLVALKSGTWRYGKDASEARAAKISENLSRGATAIDASLAIRRRPPLKPDRLIASLLEAALIYRGLESQSTKAPAVLAECLTVARNSFGDNDPRLAAVLTLIANAHEIPYFQKRVAIEHLAEAVEIKRNVKPATPSEEIANNYEQLATLLSDTRAPADSLVLWNRAIELRNEDLRTTPSDDTRLAALYALYLRGQTALELGDLERVTKDLQIILSLKMASTLARYRGRFFARRLQADLASYRGDRKEAIATLSTLLEDAQRSAAIEEDVEAQLITIKTRLGRILAADGGLEEARRHLQDARALLLRAPGLDTDRPGRVGSIDLALASIERRLGNPKAEELFQSALTMQKELNGDMPVFFGTNRSPIPGLELGAFGTVPSDSLTLGTSLVLVPGGAFSTAEKLAPPEPLPEVFTAATDTERLAIRRKTIATVDDFSKAIQQRLKSARTVRNSVLVFVHGYHVSFDYALMRAGQLARDMAFDGPVVVFSWPSEDRLLSYKTDQSNARKSAGALASFLKIVLRSSEVGTVHVLAHSMGNELFLPALQALLSEGPSSQRLGQVAFVAPDVDRVEFRQVVEKLTFTNTQKPTLYASGKDKALIASALFNAGSVRAGFVQPIGGPLVLPSVETIDLTDAGSDFFGHDTFVRNPIIMADLRKLIVSGLHPPERRDRAFGIVRGPSGEYWKYARPPALQKLVEGN